MRLAAYFLAGDPAWVEDSLASYYHLVDRIVVSYDRTNTSWSGHELRVPEALERIRRLDVAGKVVEFPGDHFDPSRPSLEVETEQRQAALDAAGRGADWVIQLDADEVMTAPRRFLQCLEHADDAGAWALDYPLRYLYQRTPSGRFLEATTRSWRPRAGFPGPAAVRAQTPLTHCRQTDAPVYRVDISHRNSDPWRRTWQVDEVVARDEANLHFWCVRTDAQMTRKALTSGHAGVYGAPGALDYWRWTARHPRLAVATTPLRRNPYRWLRFADVDRPLLARDWYDPGRHASGPHAGTARTTT